MQDPQTSEHLSPYQSEDLQLTADGGWCGRALPSAVAAHWLADLDLQKKASACLSASLSALTGRSSNIMTGHLKAVRHGPAKAPRAS